MVGRKKKKNHPKIVNKNFTFRIPSGKIALELARKANIPITANKCKHHGNPSIYSSKEIIKWFNGKVNIIFGCRKVKKKKSLLL